MQSIRLERACAELVNTNHMLGDIAINNGFANSKAFAKAFKKKNDILPSEYRKRMKNNRSTGLTKFFVRPVELSNAAMA